MPFNNHKWQLGWLLIIFTIIITACFFLSSGSRVLAGIDDYPSKWKDATQDSIQDDWGLWNRECTSFVAWRLHSRNGFELPRSNSWGIGFGEAGDWPSHALSYGYKVDNTPAVGAVAWFSYGHVAWVESVNNNGTVTIEEYNINLDGTYNERTISASSVNKYIHFKDLDTIPPTISNLKPSSPVGTDSNSASFTVLADYKDNDGGSGINTNSVSVQLNGTKLTGCNVTASNVSCGPISAARGGYTMKVDVSDNAGNAATEATQTFTVDGPDSIECWANETKTKNGDCSTIGLWNSSNLTFTLNKNITCSSYYDGYGCIRIIDSGIIIDGNHHTIQSKDAFMGTGIDLWGGLGGNTIKNVTISGFGDGIGIGDSNNGDIIVNNNIVNNENGIGIGSDSNLVKNNLITNNTYSGINISYFSGGQQIIGNTLTNNGRGISLNGDFHLVQDNFFAFNPIGINVSNSADRATITNNTFVNNNTSAIYSFNDAMPYQNLFDLNYWSDFHLPNQGCTDANNDGICDSPYVINPPRPSGIDDGKDNHPKTTPTDINANYGSLIPGDILITADPNWVGVLIPGKWKHVGMYIGYGLVVESNGNGVQIKSVQDWMSPNMGYVDYLRVSTDQATRDRAVAWATTPAPNGPLGQPYDPFLYQKHENGTSWYCSELVWAAYMHASNDQIDLSNGTKGLGIPPSQLEINASINNGISIIGGHHEKWWIDTIPVKSMWSSITFGVFCPVDIQVTDPEGRVINSTTDQIPGALIGEDDLNGDGQLDHWVTIPERDYGNYQIQVIPESNAQPTDTYSVKAWLDSDGNPPTVLAQNVPVSNIPAQPYVFNSLAMQLNLSMSSVYWASYSDYQARELSVDYTVQNAGGNDVYGVAITGSTNTNGVVTSTGMPAAIGDIPASGTGKVTLQYIVPEGVGVFRTALTGSGKDASGTTYLFPQ